MSKIPKIYKHGIEIVKPWSKEMYDYNDNVREHMIKEIKTAINMVSDETVANKLAKIINPYGYGEGYSLEDMKADMLKNAENFENYWLAEIWDELIEADFVMPNFGEGNEVFHIIGFESREEILELRAKFA
ncbi:NIPSNAP family protein [Flavobacteriaceae bacterium]|nr:NIPSNAP family protein [Flavobacteriaceae bacterium]